MNSTMLANSSSRGCAQQQPLLHLAPAEQQVAAPAAAPRQHRRRKQERDVLARHRTHEFSLWRGEVPVPKQGWHPAVVPGARTVATQLLSPDKAST